MVAFLLFLGYQFLIADIWYSWVWGALVRVCGTWCLQWFAFRKLAYWSYFLVLCTILSLYLIDRMGRKSLLISSCVIMVRTWLCLLFSFSLFLDLQVVCIWDCPEPLLLLESCSLILVLLLVSNHTASIWYLFSFWHTDAPGLGPIPWFLVTEMTPIEGRSTIQSTSTFFNWVSNAAITFSYLPFISKHSNLKNTSVPPPPPPALTVLAIAGGGSDDDSKAEGAAFSFFIFAACVLFLLLFTIFVIPETKGRSVEENMATLRGRNLNPSPTPHQPSLAVV